MELIIKDEIEYLLSNYKTYILNWQDIYIDHILHFTYGISEGKPHKPSVIGFYRQPKFASVIVAKWVLT